MTVVGKSWNRLTLPGKIIFTVVPLLIVLSIVAVVAIVLFGPPVVDLLVGTTCRSSASSWRRRSCS